MLTIVTSPFQAKQNIMKFETEVARSLDLQSRLAYARSWYALKDQAGAWKFGPSKFVGYQDVSAKTYLKEADDIDGRRTEAQLRQYFEVVDPTTSLYQELSAALSAFVAEFGKTPSTKIRICVAREKRLLTSDVAVTTDAQDAVVDLMVAVSKTLPEGQFRRLRSRLEDVWGA